MQQNSLKRVEKLTQLGRKADALGILQLIIYTNQNLSNKMRRIELSEISRLQNPVKMTKYGLTKKKKSFHLVVFTVPADHRVNMKESYNMDKYLKLAREQKNCGR